MVSIGVSSLTYNSTEIRLQTAASKDPKGSEKGLELNHPYFSCTFCLSHTPDISIALWVILLDYVILTHLRYCLQPHYVDSLSKNRLE